MSKEALLSKVRRVFGADAAVELVREVMGEAALHSLETPAERLRFARVMVARGGSMEAVGNSIAVQSILEGAQDGETAARVSHADQRPARTS